jgi:hypothetical protein
MARFPPPQTPFKTEVVVEGLWKGRDERLEGRTVGIFGRISRGVNALNLGDEV